MEAIVGGSWLNKLGVLVLVIGIPPFLAHSLTHHGPLARVATGLAVSLAMLAGGVVLERRARYVIVSRGLIGGGWAALYTTAYAAHAFESARVIQSPLIASLVLCAVALGMILHSLRYRSEVVTGVAYFVGFATLAISPITSLALVASVLLIASMLYLAYRFTWDRMAVAGVVVAYVTYIWGAKIPADTHLAFVSGQIALAAYWLLFEAFDLVGLMRRENRDDAVKALAALNAVGFLGMATIEWSAYSPSTIHILFTYAAIAFAATAALRWKLVPPSVVEPSPKIIERLESGSFEVAATLASGLMAAAIFYRFTGYAINVGLLLEAEFLFILGLRLQLKYLRALGGAVFAIAAGKVLIYDSQDDAKTAIAGHLFYAWTPTAILTGRGRLCKSNRIQRLARVRVDGDVHLVVRPRTGTRPCVRGARMDDPRRVPVRVRHLRARFRFPRARIRGERVRSWCPRVDQRSWRSRLPESASVDFAGADHLDGVRGELPVDARDRRCRTEPRALLGARRRIRRRRNSRDAAGVADAAGDGGRSRLDCARDRAD